MLFLYSAWLKLSLPTRQKLATQFSIGKTRATHVSDNQIVDDGYEVKNIESQITEKSLQEYLGTSETDAHKLWAMTLDKIEGRTPKVEAPILIVPEEVKQVVTEVVAKKAPDIEQIKAVHNAITPKKKSKKNMGNAKK